MLQLTVGRFDDEDIIERIFLENTLQDVLSDREHAILALRVSGYTRAAIVHLLCIGKTTAYTCEKQALEKLRTAYSKAMGDI